MKRLLLVSISIFLLCVDFSYAQQKTITGVVSSKDDGLPIPGASVVVTGSQVGVQTDANGRFSIKVPPNGRTLTVSFIGYSKLETPIGNNTNLKIALSSDTRQLNEVVISAGGLKVQRRSQGYTSTTLKSQEITQGKATNIASALSGKVAGLQVNAVSSGVNPNVRVVLRGNRSLLGNNQALIVLDNIIVPNSTLSSINPEDIADIQVLNGAGAAALYGSDASNGALLITTKKGAKGSSSIRVSNTTNLEQVSFFPKTQNLFGSGSSNDIQAYIPFENQQYGPAFDGSLVTIGRPLEDGSIQTIPYSATNSKNDFWKTGVTNQTDFALSTGDEKSTFYVTGQYVDQKGTTPQDKYNRVSVRVNGTRNLGNKVDLSFNSNYIQHRYDRTTETASMYDQILQTPSQIDITRYSDWRNDPFANPNGYYNEYYANPYYTLANNRQNLRDDRLIGSADLKWSPLDWLNFTYRVGIATSNQSSKSYVNKFVLSNYTKSIGTSAQKQNDIPGNVRDSSRYSTQLTSDFLANFKKTFSDVSVDFTAGASIRNNNDNGQALGANGLVLADLYNADQRYTANVTGWQRNYTQRRLGVYGNLALGYKDYLYLHVTGRNDWLSVLSPKNRSFFYPAADISFIPTSFFDALKDNKILNNLKIRAGISKVGQANILPYSLLTTFSQASGYPFSTGPGYGLDDRIVSLDLKPEITNGGEVGFDADFWDNRISTSFTYYKTSTTNQTVPAGVSNATGYTSYLVNTGKVTNAGIESSLSVIPVKTSIGLQVTIGANYTYNDNKVVSISDDLPRLGLSTGGNAQIFAIAGNAFPVILGTDYNRDPQGRVIVDQVTGYPSANPTQVVLGNTNPKHRVGLNAEIRYKSLRFTALAEYRGGFVIYNSSGSFDFSGAGARSAFYNRERFVFPNSSYLDPTTNTYVANNTVTVADGGAGFFADGSRNLSVASNYVNSASSWKIREVSLSYDLPAKLLGNQKFVKGVTIGVVGRNLLLFLPKTNLYTDPEYNFTDTNAIGLNTLGQTPPTRFYGGTLSVTL